jgi:hypothetical protein
VSNASGDTIQTKEAFATVAGYKCRLPQKVWSRCGLPIPLKTNAIVHDGKCKIDLKIMTSQMGIQIPFPLFLTNVTFDKEAHHNIHRIDHPIQRPAENSQVISVRADCRRVVSAIPIVSVHGIVI